MKKIILGLVFIFLCFPSYAENKKLNVTLFHSIHCYACMFVRTEILPPLKERYKDKVVWNELETDNNADNLTLLFSVTSRLTNQKEGPIVPTILIGNKLLRGRDEIAKGLYPAIEDALAKPQALTGFGNRNLVEVFQSISPLVAVRLGVVDGINPCAFAAIVFFVLFLVVYGHSRREVICAGSVYCLAVFFVYFSLGLGLFKFFYRFASLYFLVTAFYLLTAIMCFIFAAFAAGDYIRYKKTKKGGSGLLRLPEILNKKIGQVFGPDQQDITGRGFISLIVIAFFAGVLVSLLESVCTGQIYLPTIGLILKNNPERLKAFLDIFLYVFMFIMPILLVFLVSILCASWQRLTEWLENNSGSVKLLMLGAFFVSGVVIFCQANPAVLINSIQGSFNKNKKVAASLPGKGLKASNVKYMGIDLGDMSSDRLHQGVIRFPFAIKSVSTSCDCLKATAEPSPIAKEPDSWIVRFIFDPKGYYGFIQQDINIVDQAGNQVVVQAKANVTSDKWKTKH